MAVQFVRVVALRHGRLKPSEFRLRPPERGLSLFELADGQQIDTIIEAVRAAGKPAILPQQSSLSGICGHLDSQS